MRRTIKTREGKVLGVWVARTARGFTKKQKAEIAKVVNSTAAKVRVFVVHTKN
jgi:hypothetical protein